MSAPDHEFVAYIDESGDPNLKRVRPIDDVGGTEWMVVSAVLVRRHRDPEILKWVADINSDIGNRYSHLIHFKDLDAHQKRRAAEMTAELPLRLFVVASNKKNMRKYRNEKAEKAGSKQWFYNWLVRILIERVTHYCLRYSTRHSLTRKHVMFVFSQSGGHSYSQTAAYHELLKTQAKGGQPVLTKWVPKWQVMHWDLVRDFPQSKIAGLQLADIVASSFYQAVDNLDTGPCNLAYAKALAPRMAIFPNGSARDYGVIFQPDPDWSADITEDQRLIFRHYGFDFWPLDVR